MKLNFSDEVSGALHFDKPVIALESTVISHGLPFPQNLETAYKLERIIREKGVVPATIGLFDGEICVGLNDSQLETLATAAAIRKVSIRDLPIAVAKKQNGATTVASTSFIANSAGIRVFATGGIGGVHRGNDTDVSADLPQLAQTPIVVVCSGAKIILDLPATREWLETYGITVLGWKCDEFPAFYSVSSGLEVDERVEKAAEVARIVRARSEVGVESSILVTVPVPKSFSLDAAELEEIVWEALELAVADNITGKKLTPFLLSEMSEKTAGRTLAANIALLENNASVAAEIALALG